MRMTYPRYVAAPFSRNQRSAEFQLRAKPIHSQSRGAGAPRSEKSALTDPARNRRRRLATHRAGIRRFTNRRASLIVRLSQIAIGCSLLFEPVKKLILRTIIVMLVLVLVAAGVSIYVL